MGGAQWNEEELQKTSILWNLQAETKHFLLLISTMLITLLQHVMMLTNFFLSSLTEDFLSRRVWVNKGKKERKHHSIRQGFQELLVYLTRLS